MVLSLRTKIITIGVGLLLTFSLSGPATAVDAYPPGVTPVKCNVKAVKRATQIRVRVRPNQPATRYYTFKIDVRVGKKWYRSLNTYRTYWTNGRQVRTVNVPRGIYRIRCNAKYGFTPAISRTVTIRR